jgi:hypothetical protein
MVQQPRSTSPRKPNNPVAVDQTQLSATAGTKQQASSNGIRDAKDAGAETIREPNSITAKANTTTKPVVAWPGDLNHPKQTSILMDTGDSSRQTDSKSPDSTVPELDKEDKEQAPVPATPERPEANVFDTAMQYPVVSDMYDRVGKRKRIIPDRFSYTPTKESSVNSADLHAPFTYNKSKSSSNNVKISASKSPPPLEPSKEKAELLLSYDAVFPQNPVRDSQTITVRNLEPVGELNFPQVTPIEHLTKSYMDENGLPVNEMYIHGGNDGKN